MTNQKQREAFEKAAGELGCDESEERFNENLKRIAKAKPRRDKKADSPKHERGQ